MGKNIIEKNIKDEAYKKYCCLMDMLNQTSTISSEIMLKSDEEVHKIYKKISDTFMDFFSYVNTYIINNIKNSSNEEIINQYIASIPFITNIDNEARESKSFYLYANTLGTFRDISIFIVDMLIDEKVLSLDDVINKINNINTKEKENENE